MKILVRKVKALLIDWKQLLTRPLAHKLMSVVWLTISWLLFQSIQLAQFHLDSCFAVVDVDVVVVAVVVALVVVDVVGVALIE